MLLILVVLILFWKQNHIYIFIILISFRKHNKHLHLQWARWHLKSPAWRLLLNRLFGRRSKKTSKLRVTGLCVGNSPVTGEFPHKWPVTRKMFPFDDHGIFCNYDHRGSALDGAIFSISVFGFRGSFFISESRSQVVLQLHVYGSGHETGAVLLPGFAINW